jgi:hypothetical protein
MATYQSDIPALDPLASGYNDNPANGIVAGDALNDADVVAATRQHKNRKLLAVAGPTAVTAEEVAASKRRKHLVESSNFSGPVPPWALQMHASMMAIQESMLATQASVAGLPQMQASVEELTGQVGRLITMLKEGRQRSMNLAIRERGNRIEPVIRLQDGAAPVDRNVWFPASLESLTSAGNRDLNSLLRFCGLAQTGSQEERIAALKMHLGIAI